MNFVHTNPNCCISIGLSINKEIHAGIVYCPPLDLMFTAIKGRGALLNGKIISVSGEKGNIFRNNIHNSQKKFVKN